MGDVQTETLYGDFDEEDSSQPLTVPLGERKLVTQPYDLSLSTLQSDIENQRLLLNIEYQRKYVWDRAKASRLIESFLLNIPVPVCYFAENEDGSYEVIDGRQRIETVSKFLADEFELTGVTVLKELNGRRYSDLEAKDARRLKNRTLRCIVITEDSHPDIKFDVFERLNTGSARLAAQELRNCIYRGELNTQLKSIANEQWFKGILGGLQNNRMAYEELALRFFSIRSNIADYSPPIRQQLNTFMRNRRVGGLTESDVAVLEGTSENVRAIFGSTAFKAGQSRAFNKAVFDSIMIPISFCSGTGLRDQADAIVDLRERLLEDQRFTSYIGRATADRSRMYGRIRMFAEGLGNIGVVCEIPLPPTD